MMEKITAREPTRRQKSSRRTAAGQSASLLKEGIAMLAAREEAATWATSREAGLRLTQVGTAQAQVERLRQLTSTVVELERRMYSAEAVERITNPRDLLRLYTTALRSLAEASQSIHEVMQAVDFDRLASLRVRRLQPPEGKKRSRTR